MRNMCIITTPSCLELRKLRIKSPLLKKAPTVLSEMMKGY